MRRCAILFRDTLEHAAGGAMARAPCRRCRHDAIIAAARDAMPLILLLFFIARQMLMSAYAAIFAMLDDVFIACYAMICCRHVTLPRYAIDAAPLMIRLFFFSPL